MIEVYRETDGWTWRMICSSGRVLVYTAGRWSSILAAADDAKAYRTAIWAIADAVDHRQARCV